MNQRAFLVGTHGYSFRPGEPAEILGVVFVTPKGLHTRPCFEIRFADGKKDLVPLFDKENFKIIPETQARKNYHPRRFSVSFLSELKAFVSTLVPFCLGGAAVWFIREGVPLLIIPLIAVSILVLLGVTATKLQVGDRKALEHRLYARSAFHPDNLPKVSDHRIG
jgi:hypothetical protein